MGLSSGLWTSLQLAYPEESSSCLGTGFVPVPPQRSGQETGHPEPTPVLLALKSVRAKGLCFGLLGLITWLKSFSFSLFYLYPTPFHGWGTQGLAHGRQAELPPNPSLSLPFCFLYKQDMG